MEQGNKGIYFRGTNEQNSKMRGTLGHFGELGTYESKSLILWNGNTAIYFRGTKEQVPPPSASTKALVRIVLQIHSKFVNRVQNILGCRLCI